MSTMTLEQVRDKLRNDGSPGWSIPNAAACEQLANAIDALLREREAAKAGVTDEMVDRACEASFAAEGHSFASAAAENKATWRKCMRAALEAVAPMLASARVPDGWQLVPVEPTIEMLMAGRKQTFADMTGAHMGPNAENTYKAMLAKTAKPEISERHHWLCCGALNHDHSDKPRVMPDCFDPERRVWAVSPKPETEE